MMLEGLFYATAPRRVRVSSGRTLVFFDSFFDSFSDVKVGTEEKRRGEGREKRKR